MVTIRSMEKTSPIVVNRIIGQLQLPRPHRLTQEAIASICGVSRKTVNRIAVALERKRIAGLATTGRPAAQETGATSEDTRLPSAGDGDVTDCDAGRVA